jgi:predicted MPP superfamily phosphohydrolase
MNRRRFFKIALGAAAGSSVLSLGYARLEATRLRVERQTITVPRLPAPFAGKTIALLADLHHGPFTSLEQIEVIVDTTNALGPDLVALAGDYVVESRGHVYIAPCLRELGRLRAPLGVFAVPGNHDHYDDIALTRQAIRDNGITDVTNAGCWLEFHGTRLRLGGVDDLWTGEQHLGAALGDATAQDTCLLLCHNPDYVETLRDARVGLVLSGHLHGGQIVVPGLGYHFLPSKYGTKYLHGLVRTPYTQVYVSRGLGTTGLPLRFRCCPEINLLTLTAA